MGIAERVWFGIRRLISQLGYGRWRVMRESPFNIVDMLDECSLEGCMLADAGRSCCNKLTKDTDSQVLGHGARLDSHFCGSEGSIRQCKSIVGEFDLVEVVAIK